MNVPHVPGESLGELIIGVMIAVGYLVNHLRGRLMSRRQVEISKKVDHIATSVCAPGTLLMRQQVILTRRIADLTHDPEDIAAAEAAEAANNEMRSSARQRTNLGPN